MFTLTKEFKFEAAHRLPNHDGKCQRLHGHSWVLGITLEGEILYLSGPKQGMFLDFYDIGSVVKPFVEQFLDHHYLNETTPLANPTSEELSRWIYYELKPKLQDLKSVRINETCTSSCIYAPSPTLS